MNNTAKAQNCIIEVIRKSRVRNSAVPGEILLVVNQYKNAWDTEKLVAIDIAGNEKVTTMKCIQFVDVDNYDEIFDIENALRLWVAKSHLPIIFKPISRFTRSGKAIKCKVMNVIDDVWVAVGLVRQESGDRFNDYNKGKYTNAFIPFWYAQKIGLISTRAKR